MTAAGWTKQFGECESINNKRIYVDGLRSLQSVGPLISEGDTTNPCVICGNVATQMACFDEDGAIVLERYCDTCVKSIRFE